MTQDEIIWQNEVLEMARQAGLSLASDRPYDLHGLQSQLFEFAKLLLERGYMAGYTDCDNGNKTITSTLIADAVKDEREYYEGVLTQICVQCRSNEWGPLTHKKEILNWFHDFAANALERGEA